MQRWISIIIPLKIHLKKERDSKLSFTVSAASQLRVLVLVRHSDPNWGHKPHFYAPTNAYTTELLIRALEWEGMSQANPSIPVGTTSPVLILLTTLGVPKCKISAPPSPDRALKLLWMNLGKMQLLLLGLCFRKQIVFHLLYLPQNNVLSLSWWFRLPL